MSSSGWPVSIKYDQSAHQSSSPLAPAEYRLTDGTVTDSRQPSSHISAATLQPPTPGTSSDRRHSVPIPPRPAASDGFGRNVLYAPYIASRRELPRNARTIGVAPPLSSRPPDPRRPSASVRATLRLMEPARRNHAESVPHCPLCKHKRLSAQWRAATLRLLCLSGIGAERTPTGCRPAARRRAEAFYSRFSCVQYAIKPAVNCDSRQSV